MYDPFAEICLNVRFQISPPTVSPNHQQTTNGESEDQVFFRLGSKDDGGCHELRSFSIGNVLAFQGLQIDESLAAVMFSLGPGMLFCGAKIKILHRMMS